MLKVDEIAEWVRDEVGGLHMDERAAAIRVRMNPSPAGTGTVARTDVLGARAADLLALELEQTCDGWTPPSGVQVRIDLLDGEGRSVPPSRSRTFRGGGGFPHPEPETSRTEGRPYAAPPPRPAPMSIELDPQIQQAMSIGAAFNPGGDGAIDVRPVIGLLMLGHKTQQEDRAQLVSSFQEDRRDLLAFHREQVTGLRATIKERDAQIKILSAELTTSHRELRKTIVGRDQSRDELVKNLLERTGEAHEAVARLELATDLEALRLDLVKAQIGSGPSKVDEFVKLAGSATAMLGAMGPAGGDGGAAGAAPPPGEGGSQAGAASAPEEPRDGAEDADASHAAQAQQLGAYLMAVINGSLPPALFAGQVVPRLDDGQRGNLKALCEALLSELEGAA